MVQLANRVSEAGAGATLTRCDVNQWLRNDPRFRGCLSPPLSGMEVRYRVAATLISVYIGVNYAGWLYAARPPYTLRETLRCVIAALALAGFWREVLRCRFWDGLLRLILLLFVGGLILNILWPDPPVPIVDDTGSEADGTEDEAEDEISFYDNANRHAGNHNGQSVVVLSRPRVGY